MAFPTEQFVPLTIPEHQIQEGALQLLAELRPSWSSDDITFKVFTDGITNKLIGCMHRDSSTPQDIVLVRVYGNKTDLLIDRKAELRNMKVLHNSGLAPKLYGVFENGLAYEFLPGVTLTPDTVLHPKIWPKVAKTMALMHKVELEPQIPKEPMLWDKIEQFLALLPETFTDPYKQQRFVKEFGNPTKIRIEYERLKSHLIKIDSPIVFAHNDLLLGNVIYDEAKDIVTFIDYEYATYNYQAYDIANHFAEFVGITEIDYKKFPSKEFQTGWLGTYLTELRGREPTSEEVERLYTQVNQFVLAAHFLWGVWALVQYELSDIDFDFAQFAAVRFGEYYHLKDNVYWQLRASC